MAIVGVLCRLVHRRGVLYQCWDKNNKKEKKGIGNSWTSPVADHQSHDNTAGGKSI